MKETTKLDILIYLILIIISFFVSIIGSIFISIFMFIYILKKLRGFRKDEKNNIYYNDNAFNDITN